MGLLAGFQNMGVMTRGPVSLVPITAPPCQISGGTPSALSPAFLIACSTRLSLLAALQAALAGTAGPMPEMCPTRRGVLAFATQAAAAVWLDDGAALAVSGFAMASPKASAATAARIRVKPRPRRLCAFLIRFLRRWRTSGGCQPSPLTTLVGQDARVRLNCYKIR